MFQLNPIFFKAHSEIDNSSNVTIDILLHSVTNYSIHYLPKLMQLKNMGQINVMWDDFLKIHGHKKFHRNTILIDQMWIK